MHVAKCWFLLAPVVFNVGVGSMAADDPPKAVKKGSKAEAKQEPRVLDPFDRPDGSIHDQTARYYVWFDKQGWHVRTTSKQGRHFHGKIQVKDARIASCLSVGLDKQKNVTDAWQVNAARSELQFDFKTGRLADGFDFVVEGDAGELEFELKIDDKSNPKTIFVGRALGHPEASPFTLPAIPQKTKKDDSATKAK
jgi:hypothetical protein